MCPSEDMSYDKINSNDKIYVLRLNEITCLSEYLSAVHEVIQANPPPISKEYEDLAEVFSKNKVHELPPNCGPLDHHIHLEEGSKPVFGPIYNLSETELQVLKEYIDENLRKRFICLSMSPFRAPVLFVKPDGSLRLCIDYHTLSSMTIKNRYPLPLIFELLNRVKGTKYFTKIDVATPSIASTLYSAMSSKPLSVPVMVTLNTLSCPLVSLVPQAPSSHTSMSLSATVLIVSPLPTWMTFSSI